MRAVVAMMLLLIILVALILAATGCSVLPSVTSPSGAHGNAISGVQKAAGSLGFIIPLAILGIGLGVVGIYAGMGKLGIPVIVGSVAALVMTLATMRYANLMAVGGVLGAVVVAVWGLVSRYKGLATAATSATTALTQVVKGTQAVKDYVVQKYNADRIALNTMLAGDQTPETQAKVQEIKSDL